MRDLPGQLLMPFAGEDATSASADCVRDAARDLAAALPAKGTMTLAEAAVHLGMSRRQVEYLVEDGTLMSLYANRKQNPERRHARPIVRLERPYDPDRKKFLTLEELRLRNSNILQG